MFGIAFLSSSHHEGGLYERLAQDGVITAKQATNSYGLSKSDLGMLESETRPNPFHRGWAPMRVYKRQEVIQLSNQKAADKEYRKTHAFEIEAAKKAAQKRKKAEAKDATTSFSPAADSKRSRTGGGPDGLVDLFDSAKVKADPSKASSSSLQAATVDRRARTGSKATPGYVSLQG